MEVDPQAPTSESAPHTGTSLINTDTALIPPTAPSAAATAQVVPTTSDPAEPSSSTGGAKRPHDRFEPSAPLLPMEEVLRRRLTVIQEGDNVLLRLPSDSIKAVVASKQGLVQLGKFGSFPSSQLLGLHYDITYEIAPSSEPGGGGESSSPAPGITTGEEETVGRSERSERSFGQAKGKKRKNNAGKGKDVDAETGGDGKVNPGWKNLLRPLRRQPLVDAVIDDITETNEFIDDSEEAKQSLLSQEEITELRAQGISAEEIIQRQIERHERFGLKTDFSKEKWRKRKEKKYLQTVHPLAPSTENMVNHYALRNPQAILHLRADTLSQLLVLANIRPHGRYLVVDDTGGLVTASILDRMGCEGRVLTFTEADSPPAWGVLAAMNFGERELGCVKWLNWMEAGEDYERPPPPPEDDMPSIAASKTLARQRRHNLQVADLNNTRAELHTGNWDGLILATELNPLSVIARLSPYLAGSGIIVAYSPYVQVLAEVLQYTKKDQNFLNANITESWTRTYQVLPGRTHPLMTTSGTGGYLFHATRVFPSAFQRESNQRIAERRQRKKNRTKGKDGEKSSAGGAAEPSETPVAAEDSASSEIEDGLNGDD